MGLSRLTAPALLVALVAAVACGGDDNPPASPPATAGAAGTTAAGASGASTAGSAGAPTAGSGGASAGSAGTGGAAGEGGSAGAGGAALPPVVVSYAITYVAEASSIDTPIPGELDAVYQDDAGAWQTVAATLDAAGKGTLEVPAATYYLHPPNSSLWVFTDQRDVDFGYPVACRGTGVNPTQSTLAEIDFTNLSPWPMGDGSDPYPDELEITSLGGCFDTSLDPFAAPTPPMVGATSYAVTVDFLTVPDASLPATSMGDVVYALDQVAGTLGDYRTVSLQRSATIALDLADGATATVAAPVATLAAQSATLDWKVSAFDALMSDIPGASKSGYELWLGPRPTDGTALFDTPYAPRLFWVFGDSVAADMTVPMGYGDPFPASQSRVVTTDTAFLVTLDVPGATDPVTVRFDGFTYRTLDDAKSAPLAPTLHPPTGLTVAGQAVTTTSAADGTQHLVSYGAVGASPTIAWTAPTGAAVSHYRVSLLDVASGEPSTVATFLTTATSLTLPPGVVTSDARVYAVVEALADAAFAPKAPRRFGLFTESTAAPTGVFTQ